MRQRPEGPTADHHLCDPHASYYDVCDSASTASQHNDYHSQSVENDRRHDTPSCFRAYPAGRAPQLTPPPSPACSAPMDVRATDSQPDGDLRGPDPSAFGRAQRGRHTALVTAFLLGSGNPLALVSMDCPTPTGAIETACAEAWEAGTASGDIIPTVLAYRRQPPPSITPPDAATLNIGAALRRQLDSPAIAFSASAGGVPTGTAKIFPGWLASTAVTAFFGHIPIHRVSMMRTSRRWPASLRAMRRVDRSVASFFVPHPPSSLRAHLPQRRMMDCHGVGRVRISRFPFTVYHTQYVQAAARISPCICDRRFKRAR
jgi:hypothetical protein